MSMVQFLGAEDAHGAVEGMGFITAFDPQRFAASAVPASTNKGSGTASTQAERPFLDTERNYEQPRPQSAPNRAGQLTLAQDGRQQTAAPTEDAWGFVRSLDLQMTINPSAGLCGSTSRARQAL